MYFSTLFFIFYVLICWYIQTLKIWNICIYVNVENMWETPEKCGKNTRQAIKIMLSYRQVKTSAPKMWIKCGNVENVWKSAPKMWKSAPKMWKTLWIKCGNVENLWKTCGKLICMCKYAILSPTIQTWVNLFFSFLFLLSSFFFGS